MIDQEILKSLSTDRAKTAYKRLCATAESVLESLAASVKKRRNLSWSEEFAMRSQVENQKIDAHRNAVLTATQIELFEVLHVQSAVG